ncbi:Aim45 protein [Starmerella bacillaris]|uniref:Probable electron transfer flavoprotein subunit alpha n=1 Tax=Starmerella bacillaris TaxID=1247836 RepID=A0AAV5RP53_STABA|nr:Aim45 protein [Starmerella bacillaris]
MAFRLRSVHNGLAMRSLKARMASTLAFLEYSGDKISSNSLSALSAAKQLTYPITAILAGSQIDGAIETLKKVDSVSEIIAIKDKKYDGSLSEPLAALLADTVKKHSFTNVVAASSSVGKDTFPRLAALLDIQPVTDVTKVLTTDTFVRPIYAGNALETVKTKQPVNIITFRSSAFTPAASGDGNANVEVETAAPFDGPQSEITKEEFISTGLPDLGSAKRVVSGGYGLQSKENFEKIIYPLAEKLGAAVGASRKAVDEGYCDNSLQIGQTGKVIAPDLYIGIGVSGAIQHLAGMKDSKVIAVIDENAEAPIFKTADVGLKADLNSAVPKLTELL